MRLLSLESLSEMYSHECNNQMPASGSGACLAEVHLENENFIDEHTTY